MKNFLKRALRILLKTLLGFVVFVLLYLCCAFLFSRISVNGDFEQPSEGITIFVESNGVHTDIVVPAKSELTDWTKLLPYSDYEDADSSCKYIAFGWGDKGFYLDTPTWGDLKFSTAFKAVFFLGSTAMHVTYKNHEPSNPERSRKIVITRDEYRKLITYIRSSFENDSKGNIMLIDHKGYGTHDKFYEAEGTYSFINTCNVWTGKGLRETGVRVGWWTPFDSSVFNELP